MSVNSIKQATKCCLGKTGTVSLKDDLLSAVPDWVTTDSTRAALRQLYYPWVPDVLAAFNAIRREGIEFRCWVGDAKDALKNYKYALGAPHFQGIQRLRCGNYLALTGGGKNHSHLFIIEMHSRHRNGPFGSNLTSKDENLPRFDKIIKSKNIDAGLKHAGGFQVIGDYLVIGIEEGNKSEIVFIDVSDPGIPKEVEDFRIDRSGLPVFEGDEYPPTAGAVAILKEPDGRYLLIVGRKNSNILDFYRSSGDRLEPDAFEIFAYWKEAKLRSENGMDNEFGNYQSLNLAQQRDGTIFLVGLHRSGSPGGDDYADLFRISFRNDGIPIITKVANKHLECDGCNMDAGGGIFIDFSGSMYFYGVEHAPDDSQIKFNEFS